MKTTLRNLVVALVTMLTALPIKASGIPEPALILYGTVTNTTGPLSLTSGGVNWLVAGGGSSASAFSTIASVNGQFFFIARIPFETLSAGNFAFPASPNTLPLTAISTDFTRSATVNGVTAKLVPPVSTNFTFSSADRGRIDRVDLLVNLSVDPAEDADGDGMDDWAEEIAGTDPKDPNSILKASANLKPAADGGLVIVWGSVPDKRYSVHRSGNLAQGFTLLASELTGAGQEMQFTDSTATSVGPYFYRIQVNP